MLVFEIITPGTWLNDEDDDWASRIQRQLDSLLSQFFAANVALNLFSAAQSVAFSPPSRELWERDSQRRSEIRYAIEQERGSPRPTGEVYEIYLEAEARLKREKWAAGCVPSEFQHQLPFLYAQAFLYALDAFHKFFGVLSKEDGVPPRVVDLHKKIGESFPDLVGVRNTAQHLEDRSRGLGKGSKPLELKPISKGSISAPMGGVLVTSHLSGSRYGSTMSDGHYGEIDVSPESMQVLQSVLQELLMAFKWHGAERHSPNA